MFKPRILLVTSKWSSEDYDGGMSTALDICDTISPYCHLDVLAPSAYIAQRREGVENVIGYDIPEDLKRNYNGSGKFETRVRVAQIITPILLPLLKLYDKIIFVHIFHILDLCDCITSELSDKIILFPMMLTPSYIASSESVPQFYTEKERNSLFKIGKIITPSCYEKEQITKFYNIPASKVVTIPRYVSDTFTNNIHSVSHPKECVICYVASIKKQKQNRLALELLNVLCNQGIDAKLKMVGPIHDQDVYIDLMDYISKNNLENKFNHYGTISKAEIDSLYSKATFGISVSLCETFGRSVMEGLTSGLPMLVMNEIACLKTASSSTAGFIHVNTIEEMASSIIMLMNNPDYYKELSLAAANFGTEFRRKNIQPILAKAILQ